MRLPVDKGVTSLGTNSRSRFVALHSPGFAGSDGAAVTVLPPRSMRRARIRAIVRGGIH